MPEPTETGIYQIPLQLPGQAARQTLNAALHKIDASMGSIYGLLSGVDSEMVRVKVHGPYVMNAGDTVVTLQEPFQMNARRLWVERGGISHTQTLHWVELNAGEIAFVTACEQNEIVSVIEFQLGRDAGGLPPISQAAAQDVVEALIGTIDSTNGVNGNGAFTVSHPIAIDSIPRITIGGMELTPNVHYTWLGQNIAFAPGAHPSIGESPIVRYLWRYA